MIDIDYDVTPADLSARLRQLFELAGRKIIDIENSWDAADGTPVFTVKGRYTTRGWTEWTQGFQFGSAVLQYDVTGDAQFLELGTSAMSVYTTTGSITSAHTATCCG